MSLRGVASAMQAVEYPAPTVTDGAAPVTTTCSPASGSSFPLGSTPVMCMANDAQTRQASCSFNVSLTGMALSATRFNTFGDSITEGEMGRPNIAPSLLDPPNAYPTKLQAAFNETYPAQGIVVVNRGLSGDSVEATEAKLRQFLPVDRPEVVLLLSGYNNLTGPCSPGRGGSSECGNAIDKVAFGLRDCLRRVKEANVGVRYTFLSTLTPPGPTGSNRIDAGAILQANGRIRQLVTDGVLLVDAHSAFLGREAEFVNVDGLHLRPAGNQALADAFFAAIKATVPQTPLLSVR